ncbi:hypothetical protein [Mesobacillus maritimus]|uniref:Uncharacterized protein n=1 Tax=Mesobacillus maritimus TaxID=1643336 RepID=A0ABS7K5G2_9BACI|nr:hypothetical protein [Mesobacillus maritimus]MBY0097439.1 hypothetical protein [Mesobacillus maritimus]
MRVLLTVIGAIVAIAILYTLYQMQLGAISFFLLSIFCFTLSAILFKKRKVKGIDRRDKRL